MTKADLIEKMAEATGCTKACAGKALDGAIAAITKAVKKGDKVFTSRFRHILTFKEESHGRQKSFGQESTIKIAASESP